MTYYPVAFAVSGDQTTIPNTGTEAGVVNFPYGFGSNYSQPLSTNPSALRVPRQQFNYLMYTMTANWQGLYQVGIVPWITSAENLGTSYSYSKNALVQYSDGNNYFSLANTNTTTPGTDITKWQLWNPSPSAWTVTITASPGSTLAGQTIVANGSTLMTIPLPSTANDGDTFQVIGIGAGGWKTSQAAGQFQRFGNMVTTTGVTGYLASTNQYDGVTLKWSTALGGYIVTASIGNIMVN